MEEPHAHGCRGRGADEAQGAPRPCCRRSGGGGRGALVEPAALASLLDAGSHGYDLRRAILEMTDGALDVDPGGLYRVLRRLEGDGFVVSVWEESASGPAKRAYRLTDRGRDLAQGWLDHLRERERMAGLVAARLEHSLQNKSHDEPA
jgi:DNA-binding PadR family transcriptional regulator